MLKVSIPVLMLMMFQTGNCMNISIMRAACAYSQSLRVGETREVATQRALAAYEESKGRQAQPVPEQERVRQEAEARSRIQELTNLGGNPSILDEFASGARNQGEIPQYQAAINRADEEIARLRQEAEQRRQQEEARAKQEAEKRRQEEEARAKREAELLRQREEVRAQQAEEVRLRMQELEDLGGDTSILKEFENGSGDPEKIREYKAALSRADAEIVRLRNESNLNNQSAIDQLTEENQELRGMIEQLMRRIENLEMGKK